MKYRMFEIILDVGLFLTAQYGWSPVSLKGCADTMNQQIIHHLKPGAYLGGALCHAPSPPLTLPFSKKNKINGAT